MCFLHIQWNSHRVFVIYWRRLYPKLSIPFGVPQEEVQQNQVNLLNHLAVVRHRGHYVGRDKAIRAVLLLLQHGYTGVVQCAIQLRNRGVPVDTNTLYEELWVTGRL